MLVPRTQRHVAPIIAEQVPDPVLVLTGGNLSNPMPRRQRRCYLNVQMRNWGLERGVTFAVLRPMGSVWWSWRLDPGRRLGAAPAASA